MFENTEKNTMTATFELPGLSKNDVKIDIHSGNLAVSGESSTAVDKEERGYAIKERRFGKFVRTIRLPDGTQVSDFLSPLKRLSDWSFGSDDRVCSPRMSRPRWRTVF